MLLPQLTFECLDEGHTLWVEPKQPAASNIWVTKVHNNTQVIWGAVPRGRRPILAITLPYQVSKDSVLCTTMDGHAPVSTHF